MEAVETRVLKSRFSGMKGAKKEQILLEKSSQSYLGQRNPKFETFLISSVNSQKYKQSSLNCYQKVSP
jgi:hypothetical protein